MLLKREIGLESWGIGAVVEAICTGDESGSTWRGRGSTFVTILTEFSGGFSPHFHNFSTTIGPRSGHDRATIGPRSGFDRGPRSPSIFVGSCRGDSALEGVRSRLDREVLPQHLCTVRFLLILIKLQQPSDGDLSPGLMRRAATCLKKT